MSPGEDEPCYREAGSGVRASALLAAVGRRGAQLRARMSPRIANPTQTRSASLYATGSPENSGSSEYGCIFLH